MMWSCSGSVRSRRLVAAGQGDRDAVGVVTPESDGQRSGLEQRAGTSYSAMDLLIRRCRMRWTKLPDTVIGSFAANSAESDVCRAHSTEMPSYVRRAIRASAALVEVHAAGLDVAEMGESPRTRAARRGSSRPV